ncbi:MAG: redoxin domain-containing protein [Hungatella sp.]|nr:redoxin domain-containing protein [Hungatella sp.]
MGFSVNVDVSVIAVFLQGLFSFFSPCVLPLLPLYIGYLSGGTRTVGEDGKVRYNRGKVMGNTVFFVFGISFAFFLLGVGMTAVGSFFHRNQLWFTRIGGVLIFLLGLYQLGVFGSSSVLGKERRLPIRLDTMAVSPVVAFVMGFTFSFAWTPCVGPVLASVLIMAASAGTQAAGILLIGVYTLGFVLPFLAAGLFAASLLNFFKKHNRVVQYTVKAGGILMVIIGVMMFTGTMSSVSGMLSGNDSSGLGAAQGQQEEAGRGQQETQGYQESQGEQKPQGQNESQADAKSRPEEHSKTGADGQAKDAKSNLPPAIDFTLTDQYGNTHTLSDYKGKTIFLNFWATWCPPCRAEMPDIQKIYDSYKENEDDTLVVLGIAGPGQGREKDKEGITDFLEENGYTYPVLMDESGQVFTDYGVYSLPTTFMIDKDGNVFGYISGQLDEEIMRDIIKQTMDGQRR